MTAEQTLGPATQTVDDLAVPTRQVGDAARGRVTAYAAWYVTWPRRWLHRWGLHRLATFDRRLSNAPQRHPPSAASTPSSAATPASRLSPVQSRASAVISVDASSWAST